MKSGDNPSEKLKQFIEHAYEHAPAVKNKFDQAGIKPSDITGVKDLTNVPVTSKDELFRLQRQNPPFGGFLAVPPEQLQHIFVSPGPIYDPVNMDEYIRPVAQVLDATGARKGDIIVNTFSYHLVPPGLGLDEALRRRGATVIPAGVGNTDLQVQIMRELKATGFVGTPSFLAALIKRAEEQGFNFRQDFNLRFALVGAEMLPPSLRESFEKDYGVHVTQVYATADAGLLGYECDQISGMHVPDDMIVEIVDPVTGKQLAPHEIGEVVVTNFSWTYPLIRFGTGDLSLCTDEPCPCGRISRRLIRIVGRVGDAVKVRGMFLHPGQLREAMSRYPQVAKFQALVNRIEHRDELILKVELAPEEIGDVELPQTLVKSVQELCRLKPDKVEFVSKGVITGDKLIVDQRTWE